MEKIKLGSYTVAQSWSDVTLEKWSVYVKYASEQKEKGEEIDLITILEMFSDIPRETIMQLPIELFEKAYKNLLFLQEELNFEENVSPKIEINEDTYLINYMEKLKVKEYLDINTVLDANKYDYPMILAILCRRNNEEYNDDFIANTLSERNKMFSELSLDKVLPLIGFFLALYAKYRIIFQNSTVLQELQGTAQELVKSTETSLKHTAFTIPFKWKRIMMLRNLKKSLNSI